MNPLRIYLLSGLIAHKAYWEFMKRGAATKRPSKPSASLKITLVKAVKIAILIGILVQTLLPWSVFPLARDPFFLQMFGAVLFTLGLGSAIAGRAHLGQNWADIETPTSVYKPALVTHGLYRYIRHPIYTGDILLLVGLEMALNSWLVLLILSMIPAILRQAVSEERLLVSNIPGYKDYCRRTRRFLPFVA